MRHRCLLIALILIILTSCTAVETPLPVLQITPTATSEPLLTEISTVVTNNPEADITIAGVVMDVSLSARIIILKEPVEGFSVIVMTGNCELKSSNGEKIDLHDIQPGMIVQASGQPGASEGLLSSFVLVQ